MIAVLQPSGGISTNGLDMGSRIYCKYGVPISRWNRKSLKSPDYLSFAYVAAIRTDVCKASATPDTSNFEISGLSKF
jgi:hypothetical protein